MSGPGRRPSRLGFIAERLSDDAMEPQAGAERRETLSALGETKPNNNNHETGELQKTRNFAEKQKAD